MTKETTSRPITTIDSLREILIDDIAALKAGNTTAANVNATTNAVGKILSTVKLEMEYYRLIGRTPQITLLAPSEEPTT